MSRLQAKRAACDARGASEARLIRLSHAAPCFATRGRPHPDPARGRGPGIERMQRARTEVVARFDRFDDDDRWMGDGDPTRIALIDDPAACMGICASALGVMPCSSRKWNAGKHVTPFCARSPHPEDPSMECR